MNFQSRRGLLIGLAAAAVIPASALATALSESAPSVATPSAAAAELPFQDEALLKLVNQYLAAHTEMRRLDEIIDRAREAHNAKYPMPDELLVRAEDKDLGIPNLYRRRDDVNVRLGGSPMECHGADKSYDNRVWVNELRAAKWPVNEEIEFPEGLRPSTCDSMFWVRYIDPPSAAARARADEIVAAYDEWRPKHNRSPRGLRTVERQRERIWGVLNRLEAKINKKPSRTIVGILAKARIADLAQSEHADMDPPIASLFRDVLTMGEDLAWPGLKKISA